MQDIWIIQETDQAERCNSEMGFEVHHHQLDGSNWRNEATLSWNEFVGSHKALSSFSMPDTLVYLAVPVLEAPEPCASQTWMAMNDSPSRLAYAEFKNVHNFLMEQVRSMGKEVIVFGLRDRQAEMTTRSFREVFSLVSEFERREIEKWHRKKSGTHTVVKQDWTLGFALALHGEERWLKSRLIAIVLIGSVASVLIHLALEGLREQTQRLSAEHKQVLAQLNQNKPSTQKPIEWSWFAQTLKASETSIASRPQQFEPQTPPASGLERLAFTWSKEGNMQFMVKVPAPVHSRKISSALKHYPEGCKSGRHEWLVCSNAPQDSLDNGRE